MVLATFNLPQEIRDRLKLEDNQSELITKLLVYHYEDASTEDIDKQITSIKTMQRLQKETANKRIEELNKQLKEKEKKDEEINKKKASEEKIEQLREECKNDKI